MTHRHAVGALSSVGGGWQESMWRVWDIMWRVTGEHVTREGFIEQQSFHSRKYEVFRKNIIAIKSGNIFTYSKSNLCVYQNLSLIAVAPSLVC